MDNEYIYVPNEIFDDLKDQLNGISHTAFAYAYYYYIDYLYRYSKFSEERKTQSDIKQALGYSPKEKRVDYIIKKDGILDNMGYTQTTKDYPLSFMYDDNNMIQFKTIEEVKAENGLKSILSQRNYKVKRPIKSFNRTDESYNESILDGTYYEMDRTHKITYKVFEQMMQNDELGVVGFYIYGYFKHKSDIYGSYQCSYERLLDELNVKSNQTLSKYIKNLEQAKYIRVQRINHPQNREANLYTVL